MRRTTAPTSVRTITDWRFGRRCAALFTALAAPGFASWGRTACRSPCRPPARSLQVGHRSVERHEPVELLVVAEPKCARAIALCHFDAEPRGLLDAGQIGGTRAAPRHRDLGGQRHSDDRHLPSPWPVAGSSSSGARRSRTE